MLTFLGLPPMVEVQVQFAVLFSMLRQMAAVAIGLALIEFARRQYLRLSPGEQYRLHIAAGGYRP